MQDSNSSTQAQWSSRLAFILAAMGAAVGLGNIWKFPYLTGENGGGAFVLVYLFCIALVGLPLMMAEVMLGRKGGGSPTIAMGNLAKQSGQSSHWRMLGGLGILAGYLIVTYYQVIASKVLAYVPKAALGFADIPTESIVKTYEHLSVDYWVVTAWSAAMMLMLTLTLAKGLKRGLEKMMNFMIPALLLLMLILLVYAFTTQGFGKSITYLFEPDFSKVTDKIFLAALAHAFFTLGVSLGTLLTFGSYLPKNTSIFQTSATVAIADTIIALVAGIVIFSIVFTFNLHPDQGEGLIFKTLPLAFAQMPMGIIIGTTFFIMLFFAAFSSALGLLEPAIAWLQQKTNISRTRATVLVCGSAWLLGLGTVFSDDFFGWVDLITGYYMMPIGGLFIAIFAGWMMTKQQSQQGLELTDNATYFFWLNAIRYIVPTIIIIIFMSFIGLLDPMVTWFQQLV